MQEPTSIEHFWLMQMLGNFGAKRNLCLIFSVLSGRKTFPCHWV